jgi:hypothetical protein
MAGMLPQAQETKVFCFFSSEKKAFLPLACRTAKQAF